MTDLTNFIGNLGFIEDPFRQTNADREARLTEYFVPPRYFSEVFGNPEAPQSFFVFAPRGGGKSAQRIMMERRTMRRNYNVLCYPTYDNFNFNEL